MFEMPRPANRLSGIQALRGLAASAVVAYHAFDATLRNAGEEGGSTALTKEIASLGGFGVDIFFVISGFIMIYVHFDDFGKAGSFQRFLVKRLTRIVPNYWLLTALATILLFFAPQLSQYGREVDVPWILASFLFIPWTSSAGIPLPVLGLGWTLNYEMYFYVIFSIALLFPRRSAVFGVTAFFLLSISLGYAVDQNGAFFTQSTNWLLAEFLLGMFVGLSFRHGRSIPNALGFVLIAVSIFLLALSLVFKMNSTFVPIQRFTFFGGAAVCLVIAMTLTPMSLKMRLPRSILLLGDASYALYLTHLFTVPATLLVLQRLPLNLPVGMTIMVLFATSILVAVIFYTIVEKPSQRFLRAHKTLRTEKTPT